VRKAVISGRLRPNSTRDGIPTVHQDESALITELRLELASKQAIVDALMKGFQKVDFPVVDGLAFDVLYKPMAAIEELGGDWYDVFVLPDGRIAFSVGDVCGRGPGSAVKMAQAKQAIYIAASLRLNDPMPLPVLDQTNKVIFLNNHNTEFTTAIYGVIDLASRNVTYASAGHCPPVLARPGQDAIALENHGFPLGVELNLPDLIREHSFTYEPGSLLVLYTDGTIESSHDIEEGEARLLEASRDALVENTKRPAKFIVEHTLREDSPYPDDVAVLTILFK